MEPKSASDLPLPEKGRPPGEAKGPGCLSVISILCGGLALLIALAFVIRAIVFLVAAESAEGVVIDLIEKRDSEGDLSRTEKSGDNSAEDEPTYAPKVRFTIESSGNSYAFVSSFSSAPPLYDRGEGVTVLFDPGDVSDAMIKDFWSLFLSLWLLPILIGIAGLLLIFIPVGVDFLVRRIGRKAH